jgi:hypothetical protein
MVVDRDAAARRSSPPALSSQRNIMRKLIILWGLCDALGFVVYLIGVLSISQIPIIYEITSFADNINSSTVTIQSAILSLLRPVIRFSLVFSSYLLLRNKNMGAIISYVQLPLRLLVGPPSLFIVWFPIIKLYPELIYNLNFKTGAGIAILLTLVIIEVAKIGTLVLWQKKLITSE